MNAGSSGYRPISSYAAIGNMRSVALAGRDGSIDWCCLPYMDSPSVFASLLDAGKGGHFRISVPGAGPGEQEYVDDSNVLKTTLTGDRGRLTITDFMPLEGDIIVPGQSTALPEIHRVLECDGEDLEVEIEWAPRVDYARVPMSMDRVKDGWLATGGHDKISLSHVDNPSVSSIDGVNPVLRSRFHMRQGGRNVVITRWGTDYADSRLEESVRKMKQTVRLWHDWAHMGEAVHAKDWAGEFLPHLIRGELVFKMLTLAETGAVAAAPTTSLPEVVGGVRNWDYRYTWIRDASLTAQALISLGHEAEATTLLTWFEETSAAQEENHWNVQIMYGLRGEPDLDEYELPHLEGYRSSSPVRVGNGAAKQFQLETYGEVLSTGYELLRRGHGLRPRILTFLSHVADHVTAVWNGPDHGIWEIRGEPRHFVYSKVMAWVALDRAVRLNREYGLAGDAARWASERDKLRTQILKFGYDEEVGAFTQSYGSRELDAANLRIPLVEFLPADDARVQGTIDRTLEQLTEGGLVYRYLGDDGLPGKEGAFGLCSFWLVDVLALSGRSDEAQAVFANVLRHANQVGLFAEQFDPDTGEHLGNFPQAFTHIGLIDSVIFLALAEGKEVPGAFPPAFEHDGR